MAWSCGLFDESGRRTFERLAVFAGGWTLEAAEAVCLASPARPGGAGLLEDLGALVDASLVYREVAAQGSQETYRFRMLQTIREAALERLLARRDGGPARRRHARYFAAYAESLLPELEGAAQGTALDRLGQEEDNLRAALEWGLAPRAGATRSQVALRLAGALGFYWFLRGRLLEGRRWLERALATPAGGPGDALHRARAHNAAGTVSYGLGDYLTARTHFEAARQGWAAAGERKREADALNNLAMMARTLGDYTAAQGLLDQCLAARRELGDRPGLANALNNLDLLAQQSGDLTRAGTLFEQALLLMRELGNRHSISLALTNLATLALQQGDYPRAASLQEENLAICRELGDARGQANALNNLGSVLLRRGDYERAGACYRESLALARALGEQGAGANAQHNLGLLAVNMGQPERATTLLADSLALFRHWETGATPPGRSMPSATPCAIGGTSTAPRPCSRMGWRSSGSSATAWGSPGHCATRAIWPSPGAIRPPPRRAWGRPCACSWTPGTGPASPAPWRPWRAPCWPTARHLARLRRRGRRASWARQMACAGPSGPPCHPPAGRRWGAPGTPPPPSSGAPRSKRALNAGRVSPLQETLCTILPPPPVPKRATPKSRGRGTAEGGRSASVLTRREREVTALVSRGLTNRGIARQLTVTEGTVGTHVEHILAKLGLRSRTQVAAWAVRAALDGPPPA